MGSHSLLQRNFPTQGSKPGLPCCKQILYHLSNQGSHTHACPSYKIKLCNFSDSIYDLNALIFSLTLALPIVTLDGKIHVDNLNSKVFFIYEQHWKAKKKKISWGRHSGRKEKAFLWFMTFRYFFPLAFWTRKPTCSSCSGPTNYVAGTAGRIWCPGI